MPSRLMAARLADSSGCVEPARCAASQLRSKLARRLAHRVVAVGLLLHDDPHFADAARSPRHRTLPAVALTPPSNINRGDHHALVCRLRPPSRSPAWQRCGLQRAACTYRRRPRRSTAAAPSPPAIEAPGRADASASGTHCRRLPPARRRTARPPIPRARSTRRRSRSRCPWRATATITRPRRSSRPEEAIAPTALRRPSTIRRTTHEPHRHRRRRRRRHHRRLVGRHAAGSTSAIPALPRRRASRSKRGKTKAARWRRSTSPWRRRRYRAEQGPRRRKKTPRCRGVQARSPRRERRGEVGIAGPRTPRIMCAQPAAVPVGQTPIPAVGRCPTPGRRIESPARLAYSRQVHGGAGMPAARVPQGPS